jgi:hypothetical protein
LRRFVAVSKGAHGVFPADGVLQLYGDGGRGRCVPPCQQRGHTA